MPDPYMQKLADHLRKNYIPAAQLQQQAQPVDPMARQRALARALMMPTGQRNGRATRMSMTPVDD